MLSSFTSTNNNSNNNIMSSASAAVCGNGSNTVKTSNGTSNGVIKNDGDFANNNNNNSVNNTHNVNHVKGATQSQSIEDQFTNMAYQDAKNSTAMLHRNVSSILEKWNNNDKYLQEDERLTILTNLYNSVLNEKRELEHSLNKAQENLHRVEECIRPYQAMEDPVVSRDGHTFDRKKGRSKPLPRSMQEQGNAAKTSSSSSSSSPSGSQLNTSTLTPTPTSASASPLESAGNKHDEILFENKSLTTVLERLRNALNKGNHNSSANNKNGHAVVNATSATIGNNHELGNNYSNNNNNFHSNQDGTEVTTVISDNVNGNNNPIAMHPQRAELNARGELVHPCLRVYGYCNYHGICSFANYPYDACLSHLKGKCRFGALCHERHVEFRGPLDSNGVLIEQSALTTTEQQQQQQQEEEYEQQQQQQENEPYTSTQPSISALTLNATPVFTVQPSN